MLLWVIGNRGTGTAEMSIETDSGVRRWTAGNSVTGLHVEKSG